MIEINPTQANILKTTEKALMLKSWLEETESYRSIFTTASTEIRGLAIPWIKRDFMIL